MAVINILEDDEVIRGQLSQLLRDKGYEVIESADISSFNKIDSENTDLYLLDVYLPDGLSETEEEMDLNYVKDEGIEKDVDVVMTNSLGFGGHNATLIVRKYS